MRALLLALCAGFVLIGGGVSAQAAPSTAATTERCSPDPTTACLLGTLRTDEPLAGVDVHIVGPGVDETVTTNEQGRWTYAATTEGEYTVTLDEESLPEGVTVARGEVTVNARFGRMAVALLQVRGAGFQADTGAFDWDRLAQSAASGLRLGLLLALASIGLSLIYGTTGISNFAHAELVTLGGMLAYYLVNVNGLPLLVGGFITVVLCGLFGLGQDIVLWKPLRRRGLGLIQLLIVTIGMSLALQYTFQYLVGARTVRVVRANPEVITFGPVTLTLQSYAAMGIAVVVIAGVGWALLRTRIGQATRAVSDNPALAAASGIDVDRVVRLVWVSATALAGLSGLMLALVLNGIKWDSGMQILLLLFAAVTLGGLGTAFGALFGALVIGMVVELTNIWLPGDFKYATALAILILILLVRPQGLLGRAERVG